MNTTNNLFIGIVDSGKTASATLSVNSTPPPGTGLCGLSLMVLAGNTGLDSLGHADFLGVGA